MADKGNGGAGSKNPYSPPQKGVAAGTAAKPTKGVGPRQKPVLASGLSEYNPYAAGKKQYGMGRPMPTAGKVQDKAGYNQRDAKAAARRDALIRRAGGK